MNHPLFVFAADCHLAVRAINKHRNMMWDAHTSFDEIVNYCINHDLPLVLGGDTFDSRKPDSSSVIFFQKQITKMEAMGLPVYFIQGNHDRLHTPWLEVSSWPTHIHNKPIKIGSHRLAGMDWTPVDQVQEEVKCATSAGLEELPDVFIGHQVWKEFNYGAQEMSLAADIPGWIQLALVGDYHKYEDRLIGNGPTDEHKLHVISPGSIALQSIDEPEHKHFIVVHDDLAVKRVRLQTRPVYRQRLLTGDDLDRFVLETVICLQRENEYIRLPEEIRKPILEIRYTANLPEAYKRLKSATGDDFFTWLIPIKSEEEEEDRKDQGDLQGLVDEGVGGALKEELEEGSTEYEMALRLWGADDIEEEFRQIQTRETETTCA